VTSKCMAHLHSSPETARACMAKRLQKSADRKILRSGALYNSRGYRQLYHNPPIKVLVGNVEVWYFYTAEAK
jgi:hypothetical protein